MKLPSLPVRLVVFFYILWFLLAMSVSVKRFYQGLFWWGFFWVAIAIFAGVAGFGFYYYYNIGRGFRKRNER